jgi:putative transposase
MKMGGYLRPKLEPHREFLEALRRERSDITLKALCDRLLAERGVKADTSMMSRFFRRPASRSKKDPHRARTANPANTLKPSLLASAQPAG